MFTVNFPGGGKNGDSLDFPQELCEIFTRHSDCATHINLGERGEVSILLRTKRVKGTVHLISQHLSQQKKDKQKKLSKQRKRKITLNRTLNHVHICDYHA